MGYWAWHAFTVRGREVETGVVLVALAVVLWFMFVPTATAEDEE